MFFLLGKLRMTGSWRGVRWWTGKDRDISNLPSPNFLPLAWSLLKFISRQHPTNYHSFIKRKLKADKTNILSLQSPSPALNPKGSRVKSTKEQQNLLSHPNCSTLSKFIIWCKVRREGGYMGVIKLKHHNISLAFSGISRLSRLEICRRKNLAWECRSLFCGTLDWKLHLSVRIRYSG